MNIRTLIVDDEVLARRSLSTLLKLEPDFQLIGECAEGESARRAIESDAPDVVFLDIQMPQMDGFALLGQMQQQRMPLIVFVTAHDQFAVRAFEAQALDYLLKPFRRDRFRASLERVRQALAARNAHALPRREAPLSDLMVVKCHDRFVFVRFESLQFVQAAANYVRLHVGESTYEVRERIAVLEQRLPGDKFLRIHRSYIVNLGAIKELYAAGGGEFMISLRGGKQLPVGPSYIGGVRQALLTANIPRFGC